jgi:hypothetical protein
VGSWMRSHSKVAERAEEAEHQPVAGVVVSIASVREIIEPCPAVAELKVNPGRGSPGFPKRTITELGEL